MASTTNQRAREDALTAEAIREIGVLLVALAPLDFGFGSFSARTALVALSFVLAGVLLFRIGLRMEVRHGQAH